MIFQNMKGSVIQFLRMLKLVFLKVAKIEEITVKSNHDHQIILFSLMKNKLMRDWK